MATLKKDKSATRQKPGLVFEYLPAFASWILENHFNDYLNIQINLSKEEDIPLLKHFSHLSEEELMEMGRMPGKELLTALAENNAGKFIENSQVKWLANQLEVVDKHNILAEDIALVSLIRRQAFLSLLQTYTTGTKKFQRIMRELDRFTTFSDIAAMNTFFKIQQEKREEMNAILEEQRQDLLESQELAQLGSFFWDLRPGGVSHFTPNTLRIFEMEKTSNLDSFLEVVHPDDRASVTRAIQDSFINGGVYECEYRYERNEKRKIIWSRGTVQFENGTPIAIKGTVMDVTDRSDLMQKLKENEALYKNAEALTHIGNWSWDISRNSIVWSDEMYRIYGLEPQSEIITFERFMSLVHPDNREKRALEIKKAVETGEADDYILKIVTPAGEEKILRGRGQVQKDAEGRTIRFNGTCQDITLEHRLNSALQEKEEYLHLLINNAPDAVVVIDDKSIIRLWNPKTEKVFGWSASEVIGKHLADTIIPERYRDAHTRGVHRVTSTGESRIINRNIELTARTRSHEELVVSLTLSTVMQNGQRSFIGFIRDITKEHQTQIELKNKTLLLEQKNRELERTNEELESFNYAASHDLQEPLRKIRVFAQRIVEDNLTDNELLLTYLQKINGSATRMQQLIEDLLTFSQATSGEYREEEMELSAILTEARLILAHRIEETGTQISHTSLPKIKVVPFQFQQVITNLLSNSIKYRKESVPPRVWIGSLIVNGSEIGVPGQNFVKISFADNGIGFDPQFGDQLFDLFTRLHGNESFSGTGIGLAICKKVVFKHQGYITAESDGNSGATFHIYLPEERVVK